MAPKSEVWLLFGSNLLAYTIVSVIQVFGKA